MSRRLLCGSCAFLLALTLLAQGPSSPWRTIETKHFRVHYPAPFEAWAKRTAAAVETTHARVTDFVGYLPRRPIDIVIADPESDANGMAFPFLDRPVIVLWTTPPESESGIGDYGDWMELVLTHELAHIVHLVRPRNRPGVFARLLPLPIGPLLLTSPRWLAEGYATLVEGALTGSGRPRSSYRAMVLRRFAIEGKLPSYDSLSSTSGWLGGSMAYLVGSTYLEWLVEREGKESLPRLWKRMASRRGGGFEASFRGVFGRSPRDLYDLFRAELTARALEEEKRLEAAGLLEGEHWQRLRGGTVSPQVSPDGTKFLARRDPERGESYLAVWSIPETKEEIEARQRRSARERELAEDPEEVTDREEVPRGRRPRWRLPRVNGAAAENPRFLPDGGRILFSRRGPDPRGDLRSDLFVWDLDSGRVSRVTRLADVSSADPSPNGTWAAGVRGRYGVSELVRIDLATGETRPMNEAAPEESPRVWNHPRISPDGERVAALLHREGRWRLVVLPSGGGPEREVSPSAVGPPAWSPDGATIYFASEEPGIWSVAAVPASGGAPRHLTRVTGGAFAPAPTPDGGALFFLDVTAKGVDLRRLALPGKPVAPVGRAERPSAILPPPALEPVRAERIEPGPPTPYSSLQTQVIRFASGYSFGPDGAAWQVGLQGSDVVGRLSWSALASFGNAAGPRGGSLGVRWSGLPVAVFAQAFSALERPGGQDLVPRPELDQERRGGFAGVFGERFFPGGAAALEAGGGWTRVEPLEGGPRFTRSLGSVRGQLRLRRTRGRSGLSAGVDLFGSLGRTGGSQWSQVAAEGRLTGVSPALSATVSGRLGTTGGSPTAFDRFAVGGAGSVILPPGLDRNRIDSPGVPAAAQLGERLETWRVELAGSRLPLLLYEERLRAWDPGRPKAGSIRVTGAELRLERLLPPELSGALSLYLGLARVRSESPRLSATRGYAGLIARP